MTARRQSARLKPRKTPRQERAIATHAAILGAAARVLVERGPTAFTTNHVAERAGVSIGSLYQYYPNKASLLLRLHELESETTWQQVAAVLNEAGSTPRRRLQDAIRVFFATEADEAPLRMALAGADALFSGASQYQAIEKQVYEGIRDFYADAFGLSTKRAEAAAEITITVVTGVAEVVTTRSRDRTTINRWADRTYRMVLAEVERNS